MITIQNHYIIEDNRKLHKLNYLGIYERKPQAKKQQISPSASRKIVRRNGRFWCNWILRNVWPLGFSYWASQSKNISNLAFYLNFRNFFFIFCSREIRILEGDENFSGLHEMCYGPNLQYGYLGLLTWNLGPNLHGYIKPAYMKSWPIYC